MNTVMSIFKQIIELDNQRLRGQILPSTSMDKIRLKAEQGLQDTEQLSALFCASCEKIGMPDRIDLTVELGAAIDE